MDETAENEEEEVDLYRPSGLQSESMEKNNNSSYWDDLVKVLQLSVVLVLVIFIFVMGYLIFLEVDRFWFRNPKNIL